MVLVFNSGLRLDSNSYKMSLSMHVVAFEYLTLENPFGNGWPYIAFWNTCLLLITDGCI